MSSAVLLADLSRCLPAAALAREPRDGTWRLVDYETEDGRRGVMAFADPEAGAPELTLPLEVRGPHRVFLGVNYTKSCYGDLLHYQEWSVYGQIEVRLTADRGFTRVAAEQSVFDEGRAAGKLGKGKLINRTVQETYWRTADLTGQAMHFRLPGEPYNRPELRDVANLAWVRLEPLTEAEERSWRAAAPRPDTRCLAHFYCSGILSGHIRGTFDYHPTDPDWFRHEIQPVLDSDVGVFVFEAIRGGLTLFPTRHGDNGPEDNRWRPEWIDPLAAFAGLAREAGLKVFASLRMIGANYPMQRYPISRARHFFAHPEWVKRDRDGTPTTSWSLAYPEVRQFWLALLAESLAHDIDGVVIYLHRFHPFVLWEEPSVRDFMRKHGEDPRRLPEDDPRWIDHGAGYVTAFLREVRQLLDRTRPGLALGATFFGCPTRYDRRFKQGEQFGSTEWTRPAEGWFNPKVYGCDAETWTREGLVQYLFPMQHPDRELVARLRAIAGDRVHIWPDVMPRAQPGPEIVRTARAHYAAGADGLCFNDAERRAPRLSEWAVHRRLGHRDDLDALEAEAAAYYRRVELKTLMGYSTRYSFNNFG
ncbi:MAG: family 10 glycosylhydrolase [Opitutaceae bacterium]|nr:family 10 glycosylhydrolase [Opitutaceae bacterium]